MTGCSALRCSNNSQRKRMFRIPRKSPRRERWLLNMGSLGRESWIPTDNSRLCEEHFEETEFEVRPADGKKCLRKDAVPTLFKFPLGLTPKSMYGPPTRRVPEEIGQIASAVKVRPIRGDHSYFATRKQKEREEEVNKLQLCEPIYLAPGNQKYGSDTSTGIPEIKKEMPENDSIQLHPSRSNSVNNTTYITSKENGQQQGSSDNADPSKSRSITLLPPLTVLPPQILLPLPPLSTLQPQILLVQTQQTSQDSTTRPVTRPNTDPAGRCWSSDREQSAKYEKENSLLKAEVMELKRKMWKLKNALYVSQKKKEKLEESLRFLNPDQIEQMCHKKANRWSKETLRRAHQLRYACGKHGYDVLLSQGYPLPSHRTLHHHIQDIDFLPGFVSELTELLEDNSDAFS